MLEEQFFDTKVHDRGGFHCGEPALDAYVRQYAAQQSARHLTSVFVVVDTARPAKILGFYTLSAAQVEVGQLSLAERKKLPRYPVPCFRLGRLARDLECRGTGMGELLLGLAVERCRRAQASVGAYALLVDAKNPSAQSFYAPYGFASCTDSPGTMYLPLSEPAQSSSNRPAS